MRARQWWLIGGGTAAAAVTGAVLVAVAAPLTGETAGAASDRSETSSSATHAPVSGNAVFIGDELEWLLVDEFELPSVGVRAAMGEPTNVFEGEASVIADLATCSQAFSGDIRALDQLFGPAGFRGTSTGVEAGDEGAEARVRQSLIQFATRAEAETAFAALGVLTSEYPAGCIQWLAGSLQLSDDPLLPATGGATTSGQGKPISHWVAVLAGNVIEIAEFDRGYADSDLPIEVRQELVDALRTRANEALQRAADDAADRDAAAAD